jgi:hypothetical protein
MAIPRDLHKLACLEPLGLQLLVARRVLPGAAPSVPRVPVVWRSEAAAPALADAPVAAEAVSTTDRAAASPSLAPSAPAKRAPTTVPAPTPKPVAAPAVAFSVVAIVAGGCLWLQPANGPEVPAEQLQLIRAMAFAHTMRRGGEREAAPLATRFDWPLHTNRQLDLGEEAAAAALTGFVRRQLRDKGCHCLVLLGAHAGQYLLQPELDTVPTVRLPDSAEMIAEPVLKRDAWLALAALES